MICPVHTVHGHITAPSGVLILGDAGTWDCWVRERLAARDAIGQAARAGGGMVSEWLFHAAVVPAAAGEQLPVTVHTAADSRAITQVQVRLGLAFTGPAHVGELAINQLGTVLGDAEALQSFTGPDEEGTTDGQADVAYWGMHADRAHHAFGGDRIGHLPSARGWTDLPLEQATALARHLRDWAETHHQGLGLMVSLDQHTDLYRLHRAAGWHQPVPAGFITVGRQPVLGIHWDLYDFKARHNGGTRYPVTLAPDSTGHTILTWRIPSPPGTRDVSPAPVAGT